MGEPEKHAVIGKLVSDYQRTKDEQNLVRSKLYSIGCAMYDVAERIKTYDFDSAWSALNRRSDSFPDSHAVLHELKEYRRLIGEMQEYGKQLAALGIKQD